MHLSAHTLIRDKIFLPQNLITVSVTLANIGPLQLCERERL